MSFIYKYTKDIGTVNVLQLADEVYSAITKTVIKNQSYDVVDGNIDFTDDGSFENLSFTFYTGLTASELTGLTYTVTYHTAGFYDTSHLGTQISDIYNLTNILSGKADISGSTFTGSLSAVSISATTFYSGSTELGAIMQRFANGSGGSSSDITRIQPGSNIQTGGTDNFPTINLVANPTINNLNVTGTGIFNILSANNLSFSAISASTVVVNSNFINKIQGTGTIYASSVINSVVTPSGTVIDIQRDSSDIISGLTIDNSVYGTKNVLFARNSEGRITGWTSSIS